MNTPDIAVVMFDRQPARRRCGLWAGPLTRRAVLPLPRPLTGLRVIEPGDIDAALVWARRLVVVGVDADLAAVLTRLLRAERLDVEVGYAPRRRTAATRVHRVPAGRRAAHRARRGVAQRVPLIRDETGSAIVGVAQWKPAADEPAAAR